MMCYTLDAWTEGRAHRPRAHTEIVVYRVVLWGDTLLLSAIWQNSSESSCTAAGGWRLVGWTLMMTNAISLIETNYCLLLGSLSRCLFAWISACRICDRRALHPWTRACWSSSTDCNVRFTWRKGGGHVSPCVDWTYLSKSRLDPGVTVHFCN